MGSTGFDGVCSLYRQNQFIFIQKATYGHHPPYHETIAVDGRNPKSISHHLETTGNHCWLMLFGIYRGKQIRSQGFSGGAGHGSLASTSTVAVGPGSADLRHGHGRRAQPIWGNAGVTSSCFKASLLVGLKESHVEHHHILGGALKKKQDKYSGCIQLFQSGCI